MNDDVSFEYSNKNKETPFETFLRYTNEKQNSARVLSKVLKIGIGKKKIVKLLDIGTGNGEYLELALKNLKYGGEIQLTLLEPSLDLVDDLKKRALFFQTKYNIEIVVQTWEKFETKQKFNVILASHLYHIKREEYVKSFSKMLSLLEDEGSLIFVLRETDDAYKFKMTFKPLLFNEQFQAKTLSEALKTFRHISKETLLSVEKYDSISQLRIPISTNLEDAISIIEFYLNKKWSEIPERIHKQIITYVTNKNEILSQVDGIAIIRKI